MYHFSDDSGWLRENYEKKIREKVHSKNKEDYKLPRVGINEQKSKLHRTTCPPQKVMNKEFTKCLSNLLIAKFKNQKFLVEDPPSDMIG